MDNLMQSDPLQYAITWAVILYFIMISIRTDHTKYSRVNSKIDRL